MNIQYSTWKKQDIQLLNKSLRQILHMKEPQLYYPIMSLFFYIHNTPNSHKVIDFKRNQYLKEILEFQNLKEYNSNILVKARVHSKIDPNKKDIILFGKAIPLLDPIHYLLNNYQCNIC